jgi:hypothetical protein
MDIEIIKKDLNYKLINDLYLAELELARLANHPNISYTIQLSKLEKVLQDIIMIQTKISAINNYLNTDNDERINK